MRDITDFSAKDSKAYKDSVSLYEEAFGAADKDLLSFDEARRSRESIPTTFTKKTHNSVNFLNEDAIAKRKMSEKTNAVAELLEANKDKLKEELKLGATPEELEEEVRGDFGREILEICQAHGITRSAIWDAFDILKALIGEEPDVDEEVEKWGGSSDDSDTVEADAEDDYEEDDSSEDDEEMEESVERFPQTIEEMTKVLRHKIAEKRIREKAGLARKALQEKKSLKEVNIADAFVIQVKSGKNWVTINTKGKPNGGEPMNFDTEKEAKKSKVWKKYMDNEYVEGEDIRVTQDTDAD